MPSSSTRRPDPLRSFEEEARRFVAPAGMLAEKVVLVTGAGSGFGQATAVSCAGLGATVILLGEQIPPLEQTYDLIEEAGGPQPGIYPLDLRGASPEDYQVMAQTLEREFGHLDALLHCAGSLGTLTPVQHYDPQVWMETLQVNLNGPFLLTQACLGLLHHDRGSRVLFVTDDRRKAYWGAYGASKAGAEAFMQILADEVEANTRIRVAALRPGPMRTRMRALAYPGEDPNRIPPPEAAVPALLYFLGPAGERLHGQILTLPPPVA